jgi:hypothetical protein
VSSGHVLKSVSGRAVSDTVPVCPLSRTVCICRQYTFALYTYLVTLCTYFQCVSLHTTRTAYTAAVSPDRYTGPYPKLLSYSCKGGFVRLLILTAAKFRVRIFSGLGFILSSVVDIINLSILYEVCSLHARFCDKIKHVRHSASQVHTGGRCALCKLNSHWGLWGTLFCGNK